MRKSMCIKFLTFKAYEDLNFFQKLLYRLRLLACINKEDFKLLVNSTKNFDDIPREDKNFNDYLSEHQFPLYL